MKRQKISQKKKVNKIINTIHGGIIMKNLKIITLLSIALVYGFSTYTASSETKEQNTRLDNRVNLRRNKSNFFNNKV